MSSETVATITFKGKDRNGVERELWIGTADLTAKTIHGAFTSLEYLVMREFFPVSYDEALEIARKSPFPSDIIKLQARMKEGEFLKLHFHLLKEGVLL